KKAWLTADTRSVGFPDREEKPLELNDNFGVAWFGGTFRRPPVTLYELPELFQPWPELNTREIRQLYTEYARDCDIMESLDDHYGALLTMISSQYSNPVLSLTVNAYNQVTNTGSSYDAAGNLLGDGLYT